MGRAEPMNIRSHLTLISLVALLINTNRDEILMMIRMGDVCVIKITGGEGWNFAALLPESQLGNSWHTYSC